MFFSATKPFWQNQTLGTALSIIAGLLLSASAAFCNPLFDGADPDILIANKTYWIYPTSEGSNDKDCFLAYSSPDLKIWTLRGTILKMKDIAWIGADGAKSHELWAPGIFASRGKYYLYYAVGPQNPTPSRIGVAVADAPEGPFVDSGKALITGGNGFEAIDPMAFRDPKSGKDFLYCGGSAGSKLRVYELNADLVNIVREVPVETPENFTEGAFMQFHNGTYYLSYSHGKWNDDSYCVCYSVSSSPTGPWKYKGKILESNEEHAGPGHHAFIENPSTGQTYIVYHRWNGAKSSGKMPDNRSIAIDLIEYGKNNEILPVKMTNTGVPASPIQ